MKRNPGPYLIPVAVLLGAIVALTDMWKSDSLIPYQLRSTLSAFLTVLVLLSFVLTWLYHQVRKANKRAEEVCKKK